MNVLNSSFAQNDIRKKIKKIMSKKFKKKNLKKTNSIYGDGNTYNRAYKIIKSRIKTLSPLKKFFE